MPDRLPALGILLRKPLVYSDAARADELGLPRHVRAASSVALAGDRLYIVQSDVGAVARVELASGRIEPLPIPVGASALADLEACTLLPDGALLVVGSGNSAAARVAVEIDLASGTARPLDARPLFDVMDAALEKVGAKANLEGISIAGDVAHLVHRGAGDDVDALAQLPTSALVAALREGKSPDRAKLRARAIRLGELGGGKLHVTDAADVYGLGLAMTAVAEKDGAPVAAAIGMLDARGRIAFAPIVDEAGKPTAAEVHGIAIAGDHAWLVAHGADPSVASELLAVRFGVVPAP